MPERRVLIVGDGSARNGVLKAAAGAPNIRFRSGLDKSELVDVMQSARALIFPAEEDFGITMVEALACGTPVIAYGRGGACDIVEDGYTGVLFKAQTAESIMVAVERFEGLEPSFTRARCAERARRFSVAHFRRQLQDAVDKALRNFTSLSGQYFEGEEVAEAGAMTRSGQDDRKSVAARATTDEQVPVGVN
jgi:glycosyltransferase involved in cell wall biosynthesis